jgi:hypothetical protein
MTHFVRNLAVLALVFAAASPARADLDMKRAFGVGYAKKDYQIGDEWGKKAVTDAQLRDATPEFRRAAMATASYSGGTTFYLGKFNGHHVMATNYHVMEAIGCSGRSATFPFLDMRLQCVKVFGAWTAVDLSLFEVKVTNEADAEKLREVAQNFAYDSEVYPGEELVTMGYGVESNPGRKLMANQDGDCKVFSRKGEYRFMADPDEFNPGPYKAWSFASGCDVSHGDSGSAFIDRATGEIVGIVWTGRVPKPASVQSSAYLDKLLAGNGPEIWTALTYSVPASKIREHLREVLANEDLGEDVETTISSVIESQADWD